MFLDEMKNIVRILMTTAEYSCSRHFIVVLLFFIFICMIEEFDARIEPQQQPPTPDQNQLLSRGFKYCLTPKRLDNITPFIGNPLSIFQIVYYPFTELSKKHINKYRC